MNVSFKGIYLYSGSHLEVYDLTKDKHKDIPTASVKFDLDEDNSGEICLDGQDLKEVFKRLNVELKKLNLGLSDEFIERIPTKKIDLTENGDGSEDDHPLVMDQWKIKTNQWGWENLMSDFNSLFRSLGGIFNKKDLLNNGKFDSKSNIWERKYEKEILKYVKERIIDHGGKDASGVDINKDHDKRNFYEEIKNRQPEKWL